MRKNSIFALVLALALVISLVPSMAAAEDMPSFTVLAKTWSPYNPEEMRLWDALAEKTGIRMNFIWAPNSNYDEKVNTVLASNDVPDAVFGATTSLLLNQEAIIPLDDLLEEYCPNFLALLNEEDYASLRNPDDGHIYFIPYVMDFPPSMSNLIRTDWVEKAGMDMPETWDDWMEYWCWVRDNDANGNGDAADEIPLVLADTTYLLKLTQWFDIKGNNNYFATTADGDLVGLFEHENFRDYLETMAQLYAEGILDKEFVSRNETYKTILDTSIAGSTYYFAERANLTTATLRDTEGAAGNEALKFVAPPTFYEDGTGLVEARTKLQNNGLCITVAASEETAKNILTFFNYCFSKEGSELMNYGVEGEHCTVVDGKYVLNDAILAGGFTEARKEGIIPSVIAFNFMGESYMQILTGGKSYEEMTPNMQYFYDALYNNEPYFFATIPIFTTESYVKYGGELGSKLTSIFAQCVVGEISVDDFFAQYENIKAQGWQDVLDEQIAAYDSLMK